jgi:uncharacterized protein (DUF2062 family)/SAM-dependent methyltransferase
MMDRMPDEIPKPPEASPAKARKPPRRFVREIRDLLFKLRTQATSPGQQAAAVALGVFIGCSPFYGFHLALCLLFARWFRLNFALTYLAAHISLPGLGPLLFLAELEVGRRLRGASYLHVRLADFKGLGFKQVGVDLLLGSAVIGGVLALLFALLAWRLALRRKAHPTEEALLGDAALPYLETGMFHWEFARGKLRHDPLYFQLLRRGLLPREGTLLDLGCGRGILFSLLRAAREPAALAAYPADWAPPPSLACHGIEGNPDIAAVAREVLAGQAAIETADLREASLPQADAILLLDVLHYLPPADQETLLAKAAAALPPGGVLLLRDADAAAGWRFTATRLQERLSAMFRKQWRQKFYYRSAAEWQRLLEGLGLKADVQSMGMGTPYANVLLAGRRVGSKESP